MLYNSDLIHFSQLHKTIDCRNAEERFAKTKLQSHFDIISARENDIQSEICFCADTAHFSIGSSDSNVN